VMLRRHKEASHLSNFTFLSKKWEAVQVDPPLFFLSLQVGIVFLANSVRIRKPARSRSPLRFRQAPKAQQKPQLAKTAGSFPVFSFSEFDQLLPRLLP
ncbi:hypothetical protein, partial [Eggerthella lenta]|uniref:hypothetical protein n=1 Tax=Eggerthella lenta TaxID=84112 RepID=UPI001E65DF92